MRNKNIKTLIKKKSPEPPKIFALLLRYGSIARRIQLICLLANLLNYDFIQIIEIWLNDDSTRISIIHKR